MSRFATLRFLSRRSLLPALMSCLAATAFTACSAQPVSVVPTGQPDNEHMDLEVIEEEPQSASTLTADEDRFLRRVVPDYGELMVAGDPRFALDAWSEGSMAQEVWFPTTEAGQPSGCVPVSLERDSDSWNGQLPICPMVAETHDAEILCSFGIAQALVGSMVTYSQTSDDGIGAMGAMSHGCNIPILSATHWGDEQVTFAGVCARVSVTCTEEVTTQNCMDGTQRTCTRCSDVQTNVHSCGHQGYSVGHSMSMVGGPIPRVDCSRPCEPGITPDEVARANAILARVDWMQRADEPLNIYRTEESCASDMGSLDATDQPSACAMVAHTLQP